MWGESIHKHNQIIHPSAPTPNKPTRERWREEIRINLFISLHPFVRIRKKPVDFNYFESNFIKLIVSYDVCLGLLFDHSTPTIKVISGVFVIIQVVVHTTEGNDDMKYEPFQIFEWLNEIELYGKNWRKLLEVH